MGIIAIVNNKGGVGKTTSAQNIGAALGTFTQGNRKVLLIDLDPQGSLTKGFGIRLKEETQTVGNFILQEARLEQVILTYNNSNIDMLPSSHRLLIDEAKIKSAPLFPFNLKKALDQAPSQYDFVVIDCPLLCQYSLNLRWRHAIDTISPSKQSI